MKPETCPKCKSDVTRVQRLNDPTGRVYYFNVCPCNNTWPITKEQIDQTKKTLKNRQRRQRQQKAR